MSKLTPIIKICKYNKPCINAKNHRTRTHQKTHIYKLCTQTEPCNQQIYTDVKTAGEELT